MTRSTILEPMPITDGCDVYKMHATFTSAVTKGSERDLAICQLLENHGLRPVSHTAVGERDCKDGTEIAQGSILVAVASGNESDLHSFWLHQTLAKQHGVQITSVEHIEKLTPDKSEAVDSRPINLFGVDVTFDPPIKRGSEIETTVSQFFIDRGLRCGRAEFGAGAKYYSDGVEMKTGTYEFLVRQGDEDALYGTSFIHGLKHRGCKITKIEFIKCLTPTAGAPSSTESTKKDLVAAVQNEMKETQELVDQTYWKVDRSAICIVFFMALIGIIICVGDQWRFERVQLSLDRQWTGIQAMNTTMNNIDLPKMERGTTVCVVFGAMSVIMNVITIMMVGLNKK
jgi:hypothetical protein